MATPKQFRFTWRPRALTILKNPAVLEYCMYAIDGL